MADLQDCLKYAVGLSANDCECLQDENRPEFYNRSDSGYYLDDLEIAPPLQYPKAANATCQEFWALLEAARANGIRDFVTDFMAMSKQYNTLDMTPFDGAFADNQKISIALAGITQQYLVSKYEPREYKRGATMEVRKVGLVTNTPGTYTISIYRSSDIGSTLPAPTTIRDIDVTVTTPQKLATAEVPGGVLQLPLWKDDRKESYYFVYSRGASIPYNMKYNCGCGTNTRTWERWIKGKGIKTNDITTLEDVQPTYSAYSYGIYVEGSLSCDSFDWLCRQWNYKTDAFARVMARLIQLYSVRKLHTIMLNSQRVNAYTMISSEALVKRQAAITRMIQDPTMGNMPWLFKNMPKGVTGCWTCPPTIQRKSIRI